MRMRMYMFLLLALLLSTDIAFGTVNKTKTGKSAHKHNPAKNNLKSHSERAKRSIDEDDETPFWSNRGKKELNDLDKEEPFWANRGRRDSSSSENFIDVQKAAKSYASKTDRFCENCYPSSSSDEVYGNIKHTRDDIIVSPFWGNRGRRSSEELTDNILPDSLYWSSRGTRQESEPFWGNRGRRQEDAPFWGHRGRREDEPFWGNRGRREETPFWGHRGRRDDVDDPFWGNRGRRENSEPFWGNRGRRDDFEPFWGNRGRRKESEPFWSSRGRRKEDLKESILHAISAVENDIENLSRLRRSDGSRSSFWANRSRESKLKHLFDGPIRTRSQSISHKPGPYGGTTEPKTVHDNRIYAEEPHYIIVERNSRSSAEDDPFYISRGKKYFVDLAKAARDRRGAIEDIVKSVRNDPYYIARGKKDDFVKIGNMTMLHDEFVKAKELICATIELIVMKNENNKAKRDINDSERDRRTILKKLAAQLQMDPYFVSRGKKSDDSSNNKDNLLDFISEVAGKCN